MAAGEHDRAHARGNRLCAPRALLAQIEDPRVLLRRQKLLARDRNRALAGLARRLLAARALVNDDSPRAAARQATQGRAARALPPPSRARLRALLADPAHALFDVRELRRFYAHRQRELGLFAIRLRDRDLQAPARERERLSDPALLAFGGCGPRHRANLRPGNLSRLERRAEPREVIELARKLDERLRLPAGDPEHGLRERLEPRVSEAAVEPAVGHLPERAGELRLRLLRDPYERPELSVELARLLEPRLAFRAGPLRSGPPARRTFRFNGSRRAARIGRGRGHVRSDMRLACRERGGGRGTLQERHVSRRQAAGREPEATRVARRRGRGRGASPRRFCRPRRAVV